MGYLGFSPSFGNVGRNVAMLRSRARSKQQILIQKIFKKDGGRIMNKNTLSFKTWIGILASVIFICFGAAGQAYGNELPEAVVKASSFSGVAPLTVQFNGTESNDPDGTIRAHSWNFGDRKSLKGAIVNHTFNRPGTYAAELSVTDNRGASDQDTVTIEVRSPSIHIGAMEGSLESGNAAGVRAKVVVTIVDDNDQPVADVQVKGTWGGLVRGTSFGITGNDGTVSFVSKSTTKSGIITFRVKNAGAYGYQYDPSQNKVDKVQISTEVDTNLAPEVIITTDRVSAPAPFAVSLCGSKSYDQDGSIVAYEWELGDGTRAEGHTINHNYQEPGDYNARLIVTDNQGKEASGEIVINVTVPGADQ